jgi:hypothetical protein
MLGFKFSQVFEHSDASRRIIFTHGREIACREGVGKLDVPRIRKAERKRGNLARQGQLPVAVKLVFCCRS